MNRIYPNSALPVDPGIGRTNSVSGRTDRSDRIGKAGAGRFQEVFRKEFSRAQPLKFSAHAQQRLASSNIQLGRDAIQRLNEAVDRAAEKGAKDALLLMPGEARGEGLAFVVSVTNRTVITAMDGSRITENVFTNIDSAVVV